MGQQQLLLLVLGTVIVGLAVVGGIQAFQQGQADSQRDSIVNESFRIATDIQAERVKPTALGGGGGTWPASLQSVYPNEPNVTNNTYNTPWGSVTYEAGSDNGPSTLTLDANGLSADQDPPPVTVPWQGSPSINRTN